MEKLNKKVIIIGSGPAGYTAALYLARAGYTPLVIAGALTPGGQLMNTTEVENYPGFVDGILGPDLMEAMQKQAEKFGAQIILNDVVSVDFKDDLKTVTTDDGETYTANAVIISTGSQVRKLGVPGEQEYSGRGVSYCATCDGFFFRGKPIVVIGGGDSAFEEALFLTRFGSSVTLIHRRDSFRASKIMIDRARKNEKIKFVLNSVVQSINGSNEDAQSVTVKNVVTGETQDIEASGIFVAIGHLPSTSFLNNSIALNADGTISVQGASTKTSIPGIFAAGDVVDSVYRQAISAAGMGCRAALDAQAYLNDLSE
ncbi:thioredoxin-disulfide reductase [Gardnerella vaginalis]|uniref:Thioredoxin reductase n=1 Tax=Gardnerella vaginalis TaxID=2702 RepID=A0ABD4ZEC6_GARVA|nr:thioredoxin-disulfide reductase [Gardnerella vaginalis]MDK6861766.1 thioredoxin-disulfide reductase [Gardnerella vaginalis]MDK8327905.1 thioredoxin-disulfide reductase [Gardnerella vaginalis]PKZ57831.1 thioredoxin-disulfide reductase [Gardnerella vaginalis]PKZ74852.1 thioredoxin-disulfide reductase [Gardnerella vaginalis]RIY22868.1 thioredoxin-disulfide reductase [Gardnerella vaginalis]